MLTSPCPCACHSLLNRLGLVALCTHSDGMNLHRAKVSGRNTTRFSITNYHDVPLSTQGSKKAERNATRATRKLESCLLRRSPTPMERADKAAYDGAVTQRDVNARLVPACVKRGNACRVSEHGLIGTRSPCTGAANRSKSVVEDRRSKSSRG